MRGAKTQKRAVNLSSEAEYTGPHWRSDNIVSVAMRSRKTEGGEMGR